jgi:hypothetical protein
VELQSVGINVFNPAALIFIMSLSSVTLYFNTEIVF